MRKSIVILIASLFVLTGCRTSQSVENTIIKTDTVYVKQISIQRHDSLVYVHDSILQTNEIYVTLDTAGNEIKRIEYHNKDHYSKSSVSTNSESLKADTSKVVSNETSKVVERTIKTNSLTLFQSIQIWAGRVLFSLFILILLYLLVRTKFSLFVKR